MDKLAEERIRNKEASGYIFAQNKVFLEDIINVAEVSI
jgi:hypothetical protein